MSKERELWIGFHGIFRLRKFFMNKMPRLYAKLFFRSFIRSKAAFREALTGGANNCEQEYMYARYINSWIEKEEDHRKVMKVLGEWLYKENLVKLLDTLVDVFVFDGDIVIATCRPGMWIGDGGSTFGRLETTSVQSAPPSRPNRTGYPAYRSIEPNTHRCRHSST